MRAPCSCLSHFPWVECGYRLINGRLAWYEYRKDWRGFRMPLRK